jgi:predicted nucleic acid-binding protein
MTDPTGPWFFDTNVIVYLTSAEEAKADRSEDLVRAGGIVSVQVLNEFVSVALKDARRPWSVMRQVLDAVHLNCSVVPIDLEVHERALRYLDRYRLHIHDANIVAAAVLSGCTTLWSEDMKNGQVIDGLTIRNPYAA